MDDRVSVIVPHFYQERIPNLSILVERLLTGSRVPDEILIWNNDAPLTVSLQASVRVVQSEKNHGPQARILAAQFAVGSLLIFHDNDVAVRRDTVACLVAHVLADPDAIWTLDARKQTSGPYRTWEKVRKVTRPTDVTISLGRVEAMTRPVFREIMERFPWGDPDSMDDVELSHCAAQAGIPIYVPPTEHSERFDNLAEGGVGARRTIDHYARRDALVHQYFQERNST